MSAPEGIVLQNFFASPIEKSHACRRVDRILMWGTASFSDQLTGDVGGALEAALIDGCRLFRSLAEIWSHCV
jgi:hypothetical protein